MQEDKTSSKFTIINIALQNVNKHKSEKGTLIIIEIFKNCDTYAQQRKEGYCL